MRVVVEEGYCDCAGCLERASRHCGYHCYCLDLFGGWHAIDANLH